MNGTDGGVGGVKGADTPPYPHPPPSPALFCPRPTSLGRLLTQDCNHTQTDTHKAGGVYRYPDYWDG